MTVSALGLDERLFSLRQACIDCGVSIPTLEPRSFSFNSRHGACPECAGMGTQLIVNPDNLVIDPSQPVATLKFSIENDRIAGYLHESLLKVIEKFKIDTKTPFEKLTAKVKNTYFFGGSDPGGFGGIDKWLQSVLEPEASFATREEVEKLFSVQECTACKGSRLRAESRSVKINNLSISDYARLSLENAQKAFGEIKPTPREAQIAGQILREIQDRMEFLLNVGVGYLALDRPASSLSGGEGQRIRLATQIGSKLRGVLYVLDEPSIGLHPRDNRRLLDTLAELRDIGNTILVVEHDEETIRSADHILDLGPGGGRAGGNVVAAGSIQDIVRAPNSYTGKYLTGELRIEYPKERRKGNGKRLVVKNAHHNNLRNIDVEFPLGLFTCVTGVSGAGKSSLVGDILYKVLSRKLHRALTDPDCTARYWGSSILIRLLRSTSLLLAGPPGPILPHIPDYSLR